MNTILSSMSKKYKSNITLITRFITYNQIQRHLLFMKIENDNFKRKSY